MSESRSHGIRSTFQDSELEDPIPINTLDDNDDDNGDGNGAECAVCVTYLVTKPAGSCGSSSQDA
jgi:hypothetical protein